MTLLSQEAVWSGGVVSHPSLWSFCGYNEIQERRKKNILIHYERLQELMGARSYEEAKELPQGMDRGMPGRWGENPPGGMDT